MNRKLKKLAVPGLRWTLGLVVLIESFRLAFEPAAIQHFARTGLPPWVRVLLAGGEIIAAILFMGPLMIGGYALIVIFAFAAALHVLHGQYDIGALVVYGMAVLVAMANRDAGTPESAHDGQ